MQSTNSDNDTYLFNAPIKVFMIALARYGGTLRCARKLASAMAKFKQIKLAFIGSSDSAYAKDDELACLGLQEFQVSTGMSARDNFIQTLKPQNYTKIVNYVRQFQPDIIHYPLSHAWDLVLAIALNRYATVRTVHDPVCHLGEDNRLYAAVQGLSISLADRIIVLSEIHRGSLTCFGKSLESVDVVHHGEFGIGVVTSDVPLSRQILFFGRLLPYKGIDILIDAFKLLVQRYPDYRLVVAGRGTVPPKLKALAINSRVEIYNDWLSDKEINRKCIESDFAVFPYIDASQSGAVAVAQSLGRPVIVTRVGGLPEQIIEGETGLIVPPSNAQALTCAMEQLINNPQMAIAMGKKARHLYTTSFNWEAMAEQTVQVYYRALAGRQKRCMVGITNLAKVVLSELILG